MCLPQCTDVRQKTVFQTIFDAQIRVLIKNWNEMLPVRLKQLDEKITF